MWKMCGLYKQTGIQKELHAGVQEHLAACWELDPST